MKYNCYDTAVNNNLIPGQNDMLMQNIRLSGEPVLLSSKS